MGFIGEGGHTIPNVRSNIDVYGYTCDVGGEYAETFEATLDIANNKTEAAVVEVVKNVKTVQAAVISNNVTINLNGTTFVPEDTALSAVSTFASTAISTFTYGNVTVNEGRTSCCKR